ncbi:MAG TPA: hypothetical protein VJ302_14225 [Blastocatellia bacterium]|nr:hypothetical protein [Blastocatellia bacterium]
MIPSSNSGKRFGLEPADLLSFVFLLLLPFIFFWRETLGWFTLGEADMIFWHFPVWRLAVEQVRAGQLPLWNPYLYSGTALFAAWQSGVLDPLNWVHLLGPTGRTLTLSSQLSLSLALLGTYYLARGSGLKRRASIVSAVIYGLSGFVVGRTIYPGMLHVMSIMPLVLWSIERLWQTGRWFYVLAGGMLVTWQIFAGHPQLVIYSSLLAVAYAAFRLSFPDAGGAEDQPEIPVKAWLRPPPKAPHSKAPRLRFLIQFPTVFVMALACSAVQWLPVVEVAGQSVRQKLPYWFFTWQSIHPISLLTMLFPFFHGQGRSFYHLPYWGYYWHHNEAQIYLGVMALSLALGGAICGWRFRSRPAIFWSLVAVTGMILALGKYVGPAAWILYQVPLLNGFRSPNRHWVEVGMAVSMLAGIAVDRLLRGEARALARTTQIVAWTLAALTVGAGAFILNRRNVAETIIRSAPDLDFLSPGFLQQAGAEFYLPMLSAIGLAVLVVHFTRTRTRARWYPWLLAALLVDLNLYATFAPINNSLNLESHAGRAMPPELAALQSEHHPVRYHLMLNPEDQMFNPFWFYGSEMATGYDPLVNRHYLNWTGINEAGCSLRPNLVEARDWTLDLLNVRYLLVSESAWAVKSISDNLGDLTRWRELPVKNTEIGYVRLRFFENLRVFPRVWIVDRVESRPEAEQLALIRGELHEEENCLFDPSKTALIDPAGTAGLNPALLAASGSRSAAASQPPGRAEILRRVPGAISISADVGSPSLLVLSEVFYPGWRARVDGTEVELRRVNYLMRGIELGSGRHEVEVFYRPRSMAVGMTISIVSLFLIASIVIWRLSRRDRWKLRDRRNLIRPRSS